MAARCLFFLPDLDPPCEVIRRLALGPAIIDLFAATRWQLCRANAFIECPIFDYLEKVHEASEKEADMQPRSEP